MLWPLTALLLPPHRAKRRHVNDAYVGTLSSYAYVLMCISHLQVGCQRLVASCSQNAAAIGCWHRAHVSVLKPATSYRLLFMACSASFLHSGGAHAKVGHLSCKVC